MNYTQFNSPLKKLAMAYICIQLAFANLSYAGDTIMTVSNGSPVYGELDGLIGPSSGQGAPTTTVTLITTCTNGTVSVTYTPSSGVTKTSDTGSGSTRETAVFAFDATTVGNVNTIDINVSHNAQDSNGNPCLPGGQQNTFTIWVPKITSTTVATTPSDQTRKTIGVGEEVNCTTQPVLPSYFSPTWTATNAGTINSTTGDYTAGDIAESEDVTLKDFSGNQLDKVTFTVVAPSTVTYTSVSGKHLTGYCNAGFIAPWQVQPTTVSFYNIQIQEEMANYSASGYFSWANGQPHESAPTPADISQDNVTQGYDASYSGYNANYPFPWPFSTITGNSSITIPMDYRVNGGSWHTNFYSEACTSTPDTSGACTQSKDGTSRAFNASDATVGF